MREEEERAIEPVIRIRNEQTADRARVETLTREAFYNLYVPGCVEHYLVHIMREHADFIPELDFVVERDGSLTNIQVLQSPDRSLSDEAVRVLKTSPKWTPGKQRNQAVRVKYTLPIDFRIQN